MYDTHDQTTAAVHYSNAKEAFNTAIGLASAIDDAAMKNRLHVNAGAKAGRCSGVKAGQ